MERRGDNIPFHRHSHPTPCCISIQLCAVVQMSLCASSCTGVNRLFSSGSWYHLVDNPSQAEGTDRVDVVPWAGFSCPPPVPWASAAQCRPLGGQGSARFESCRLQIAIAPSRPERGCCEDAARQSHSDIFIAPHKDQLLL